MNTSVGGFIKNFWKGLILKQAATLCGKIRVTRNPSKSFFGGKKKKKLKTINIYQ